MAVTGVNPTVGRLALAKQSALGTPATTALCELSTWISGGLSLNEEEYEQDVLNGKRFSSPVQGKTSITGEGTPVLLGRAREAGVLAGWMLGSDAVSGAGPYTHTGEDSNGAPILTGWQELGTTPRVGEIYADMRMTRLEIGSNQRDGAMRISPSFLALDAGKTFAAFPSVTLTDPGQDDVFEHVDLEGSLTIEGVNGGAALELGQISSLSLIMEDGVGAYRGETIRPRIFTPGRARISVALTVILSDETLELWNLIHYGSASPANGTRPSAARYKGSLAATWTSGTTSFGFSMDAFRYRTDTALEGQADGGAIELAIGGMAVEDSAGANLITTTTVNGDASAY